MQPLKFIALDKDDLEVISAHLQDATVKIADVHWRPQEKRLVLGVDRFDWTGANASPPEFRRCRAALRFDRVLACKCKRIDPAVKDGVINLLAIEFAESDPPAGAVTLIFSGGHMLRVEVECLEVELSDLGPAWETKHCPAHRTEDQADPQQLQG